MTSLNDILPEPDPARDELADAVRQLAASVARLTALLDAVITRLGDRWGFG